MRIFTATTLEELLPIEDDQDTFDSFFEGWHCPVDKKDIIELLDDLDPNEEDYKEQVKFVRMVLDTMSRYNIDIILVQY